MRQTKSKQRQFRKTISKAKSAGFIVLLSSLGISHSAFGWGARGHHAICESAVFLIKAPELKKFLSSRPQTLGHLCNIPDIYWKSTPEFNKLGGSAHYIDLEYIKDVPEDKKTNFSELEKILPGTQPVPGQQTIKSVHQDVGSIWWRANQFVQLASDLKAEFAKGTPPSNRKEDYDDEFPFNKTTFQFLTYIGVLGHFVGDNSQPFHVTYDYDGYESGHGGIHSYYEEDLVAEFDADLTSLITLKARQLQKDHESKKMVQKYLTTKDPVVQMKALSEISFTEIPKIFKLDKTIKPSVLKQDKGMKIKTAAERKSASQEFPKFKKLIINQMARSSLLLANFWETAFENAGSPNISKYKAYKYPFTPDFIAPNYIGEVPKDK
jgi:hypothetical protein